MNHFSRLLSAAIPAMLPALAHADKSGCTGHSLFPTRIPDYAIENCKVGKHDRYDFWAVRPFWRRRCLI